MHSISLHVVMSSMLLINVHFISLGSKLNDDLQNKGFLSPIGLVLTKSMYLLQDPLGESYFFISLDTLVPHCR